MKTQSEIYKALLDGEVIIFIDNNYKIRLIDGFLEFKYKSQDWKKDPTWAFVTPEDWKIHKEPEWYENIGEGGVLCVVWNYNSKYVALIMERTTAAGFIDHNDVPWLNAKPLDLTKSFRSQLKNENNRVS